jgi:hypothetical protein
MANALNVTVASFEKTASEGGAFGMALLAQYILQSKKPKMDLKSFLAKKVFIKTKLTQTKPQLSAHKGFLKYMDKFIKNLPVQSIVSN